MKAEHIGFTSLLQNQSWEIYQGEDGLERWNGKGKLLSECVKLILKLALQYR